MASNPIYIYTYIWKKELYQWKIHSNNWHKLTITDEKVTISNYSWSSNQITLFPPIADCEITWALLNLAIKCDKFILNFDQWVYCLLHMNFGRPLFLWPRIYYSKHNFKSSHFTFLIYPKKKFKGFSFNSVKERKEEKRCFRLWVWGQMLNWNIPTFLESLSFHRYNRVCI